MLVAIQFFRANFTLNFIFKSQLNLVQISHMINVHPPIYQMFPCRKFDDTPQRTI